MKTLKPSINAVLLLSTCALSAILPPSSASDELAIKGTEIFVDNTPISFNFPFSSSLTTAEGKATHLGHYVIVGITTVNVATASATGTLRVITDGGDILFVTVTGHALFPFSLKETVADMTITGGTGRFEGATGGWHVDSHFAFPVNAGVPQNSYVAELTGIISKAAHGNDRD
jgi:hypothetical protein